VAERQYEVLELNDQEVNFRPCRTSLPHFQRDHFVTTARGWSPQT